MARSIVGDYHCTVCGKRAMKKEIAYHPDTIMPMHRSFDLCKNVNHPNEPSKIIERGYTIQLIPQDITAFKNHVNNHFGDKLKKAILGLFSKTVSFRPTPKQINYFIQAQHRLGTRSINQTLGAILEENHKLMGGGHTLPHEAGFSSLDREYNTTPDFTKKETEEIEETSKGDEFVL